MFSVIVLGGIALGSFGGACGGAVSSPTDAGHHPDAADVPPGDSGGFPSELPSQGSPFDAAPRSPPAPPGPPGIEDGGSQDGGDAADHDAAFPNETK